MFIFYLAKRSSCEIKRAFVFLIFISAWVALSILPIHINNSDETNKTIMTILGVFPVFLTSFYVVVAFVYVAFNKNADDDHKLNIFALLLTLAAWVVSWSAIYMIYWTWYDNHAFPIMPVIAEPYEAWEYCLGISAGIYSSDQPPTADAHMGSLALIIGLHSMLSLFINGTLLAVVLLIGHEMNAKRAEAASQKNRGYPIDDRTAYYSTQSMQNTGYIMSVDDGVR